MTNGQILFINFGAKNINNILKTETCVERKKLFYQLKSSHSAGTFNNTVNISQITCLDLRKKLNQKHKVHKQMSNNIIYKLELRVKAQRNTPSNTTNYLP